MNQSVSAAALLMAVSSLSNSGRKITGTDQQKKKGYYSHSEARRQDKKRQRQAKRKGR